MGLERFGMAIFAASTKDQRNLTCCRERQLKQLTRRRRQETGDREAHLDSSGRNPVPDSRPGSLYICSGFSQVERMSILATNFLKRNI